MEFIIVILVLEVIAILVASMCELNSVRDLTGRMRRDIQMSTPTFAKNGRVKSFKATWFQALIGMFLRTIVVAFAEILIFVVVDLS